ncbi:MAG TPA: FHIPEP family type III secretion protein [Candidatus Xenobia bacterium]
MNDAITVELGPELRPLIDRAYQNNLLRLAEAMPAQFKKELGFQCPHIKFHCGPAHEAATWSISFRETIVASGELRMNRLLALGPEDVLGTLSGAWAEPMVGTAGLWIETAARAAAEKAGCVVVEPARVLAVALHEALRTHAHALLAESELRRLLKEFEKQHAAAYHAVVGPLLSEEQVHEVLRRLVREQVSIVALPSIFSALARHARPDADVYRLTERVRQTMGADLWGPLARQDQVSVFTLDGSLQDALEALLVRPSGSVEPEVVLGNSLRLRLLELIGSGLQQVRRHSLRPVLLCRAPLRRALKRLTELQYPHLVVLSLEETPATRVNNLLTLSLRLTAADRLRVLTGRLTRWWGQEVSGSQEAGADTRWLMGRRPMEIRPPAESDSNTEEPDGMEPNNEYPSDPASTTGRGAEEAPQVPPPVDDEAEVEPEMAAAMVLSGNFTKALTDRVMASLSHDEMMRLASGLVRLRHVPENKLERIWNRLASLYAWDWRDEDDLIEFIKNVLRKGFKQEPSLTNMQKLAMMVLLLPEETSEGIARSLLTTLPRAQASELTRELAHLLHYPNTSVHEHVVGEFLATVSALGAPNELPLSLRFIQMEADRIAERDPVWCAGFIRRIWLDEKDPVTQYQEAARHAPGRMVQLLHAYLTEGATRPYISGTEKAAILIQATELDASERMKAWLTGRNVSLPEVTPTATRKQAVVREFLHLFYTEMATSTFPRPN